MGRTKDIQVNIRMTAEQRDKLRAKAVKQRVTVSELVLDSVLGLGDEDKLAELLADKVDPALTRYILSSITSGFERLRARAQDKKWRQRLRQVLDKDVREALDEQMVWTTALSAVVAHVSDGSTDPEHNVRTAMFLFKRTPPLLKWEIWQNLQDLWGDWVTLVKD